MTIKLYLDEDVMSGQFVRALRTRAVDVISVRETQMQGYTDEQQLQHAVSQGRVLYSFNIRDYMILHRQWMERRLSHAGIILAEQQRYSVGEQLHRIVRIMSMFSAEEMINQVLFLSSFS